MAGLVQAAKVDQVLAALALVPRWAHALVGQLLRVVERGDVDARGAVEAGRGQARLVEFDRAVAA